MYKSCSKCGKIHRADYKCSVSIPIQTTDERRLRSKYAWTKKSAQIRERANYLCEACRDKGIYTYAGVEVHHITKLKDDREGLLDDANLVCLCVECHKKADAGEIDPDYLRHLASLREGRI